MVIHFQVDHLDQFAQGVFKDNKDVFFIPKTLPGEEGDATILKKKKGVHFCQLKSLKPHTRSPLRKEPDCPHYKYCSGCHYLHMSYQDELAFKTKNLERSLQILQKKGLHFTGKVTTTPSRQREGHRNRIQLHYDAHSKKFGFIQNQNRQHQILDVPNCLLPHPLLQKELKRLYLDSGKEFWRLFQVGKNPPTGHVELSLEGESVVLRWNQRYSQGGFVQVNAEMNEIICKTLFQNYQKLFSGTKALKVFDLFGGNGNLTKAFQEAKTIQLDLSVVDYYQEKNIPKNFHSLNLYDEEDFEKLLQWVTKADLLVVDPPRSGWTYLDRFCQKTKPQRLFYLSCDPATLFRDILSIKNDYEVESVNFFDMFPGTYHMETLMILRRMS